MGKSTISMAIFNCYVSSPEGILSNFDPSEVTMPPACLDLRHGECDLSEPTLYGYPSGTPFEDVEFLGETPMEHEWNMNGTWMEHEWNMNGTWYPYDQFVTGIHGPFIVDTYGKWCLPYIPGTSRYPPPILMQFCRLNAEAVTSFFWNLRLFKTFLVYGNCILYGIV